MTTARSGPFITGASRGFGHVWARAALDRGDRVAATARNPRDLQDLSDAYGDRVLPLTLDVTDRPAVFAAVASAVAAFGGLDVVVNNAGYGLFGMVEEVTEEQARAQMETNFFDRRTGPVRHRLVRRIGCARRAERGLRAGA
ncbi:hypothetical protein GCM10010435_23660 [Winogradskya consettensis]|uniref:Uncharacterized protein n=1 Tax=Winogradskya consettensis TaxID=113560 RepID=A0A919W0U7_9ACTN|nr:hypothetical protein Aco04nite_81060 [Actinoplanes consettensis]